MAAPGSPPSLPDLVTTWRTLLVVTEAYELNSSGAATLVEARRLMEVEVRLRYGDAAWERLRVAG